MCDCGAVDCGECRPVDAGHPDLQPTFLHDFAFPGEPPWDEYDGAQENVDSGGDDRWEEE